MGTHRASSWQRIASWVVAAWLIAGCRPELEPEGSYYEEQIDPILGHSCSSRTVGCHTTNPRGSAAGNLDTSSYDALRRREDLLVTYGPYPLPGLLMEISGPHEVSVEVLDPPDPSQPEQRFVTVTTDFRHGGGPGDLEPGTSAFLLLRRWLESGYQRTGAPRVETIAAQGPCSPGAGSAAGFDASAEPADAESFARFVAEVQPVLSASCASVSCHGAPLADLHLACGETDEELRWNYFIASAHLGDPAQTSELIRRPLAPALGGSFHAGGSTFTSVDDPSYQALLGWGQQRVERAPELFSGAEVSAGYRYFANRVQPTLVRRGCMTLGCHSPISLRFQLRGGAGGSFSRFARDRNYELALSFLSLESPSPTQSRIVAKNLFPPQSVAGGEGLLHRGGSLFEQPERSRCDEFDVDAGDLDAIPSYCILARWHQIERGEAIARGEVLPEGEAIEAMVWVERSPGIGTTTAFDEYRPGADLRIATSAIDPAGWVVVGPSLSALPGCGLDAASADVRSPAVSWDGERIAFSVRESGDRPSRIYWMRSDGSDCEPVPGLDGALEDNGILIHDFDPAFAADGTLVFASTRGNLARPGVAASGPSRTPARLEPNANLYALDLGTGVVRQITFLLDQELQPSFMADGHLIYAAEKRAQDFHVIALRRQLLDGGDYHPLYASRPSLGFESATEVVELVDGRFAFVASTLDAPDGAGSLVFADRSIGPDQATRDPARREYLPSMDMPVPGAGGFGEGGAYRSPSPLPSGHVLAACDLRSGASAPYDFDLCEVNPSDGEVRVVTGRPGLSELDAVAVYARTPRRIARSDGRGVDHPIIDPDAGDAIVRFTDFPMIQSLMFENTRNGRSIDLRIGGFEVWEQLPPPVDASSFDTLGADVRVDRYGPFFLSRRLVGWVPLFEDGSARMRVPAGRPLAFAPTGPGGEPLEALEGSPVVGRLFQREWEQYYPGERITRSVPRRFFNSLCGGCHGSISGREIDVAVSLDAISGASSDTAREAEPVDLMR